VETSAVMAVAHAAPKAEETQSLCDEIWEVLNAESSALHSQDAVKAKLHVLGKVHDDILVESK
jgi:hypothetical protein